MVNSPYAHVLLAGLIWGTNGLFIKKIQLPVLELSVIRVLIPTLVTWVYLHFFKGINPWSRWRKWMVIASVLNVVRVIGYFLGFSLTSVGNGILALYTWPLFVTLFASLMLKEKLTKPLIFTLVLAMLGIIIIESSQPFTWHSHDLWGLLVMLGTSMITAVTIIIYKAESPYYSQAEGVFFQNAIGALIALPAIPWLLMTVPAGKIVFASAYAFTVGILGFTLFFSALAKIPSSHASLLSYFEVLVTIITGVIWLHEPLTPNLVLGGTMVIVALILCQTRLQKVGKKIQEEDL